MIRDFLDKLRLGALTTLGVQGDGVDVVIVDDLLDRHDCLLGKSLVLEHYGKQSVIVRCIKTQR